MAKRSVCNLNNNFNYNAAVYIVIGIGIGALLTYPLFGAHPVRWGIALIALGIAGYLYPIIIKK